MFPSAVRKFSFSLKRRGFDNEAGEKPQSENAEKESMGTKVVADFVIGPGSQAGKYLSR